jgi:hypothetical protein
VARGRSSRIKGKVYEREVVHVLRAVYPHCARGIGQARDGAERPDVVGTPFWVECGAGQTIKIPVKVRQALNDSACSSDDTYAGAPALVFTRSTRGEHIVSMERGQFVELLMELEHLRQQARKK